MDRERAGRREGGLRYRIVVDGELPPDWAGWFGADSLRSEGGRSTLEIRVADQAQLHGLLRRAHDVHLTLRSVRLLDDPADFLRGTDREEPLGEDHEDR